MKPLMKYATAERVSESQFIFYTLYYYYRSETQDSATLMKPPMKMTRNSLYISRNLTFLHIQFGDAGYCDTDEAADENEGWRRRQHRVNWTGREEEKVAASEPGPYNQARVRSNLFFVLYVSLFRRIEGRNIYSK
jgi:hypothetical protein